MEPQIAELLRQTAARLDKLSDAVGQFAATIEKGNRVLAPAVADLVSAMKQREPRVSP